jgi:putative component of toxin-antitoxin plasmid stabilization module
MRCRQILEQILTCNVEIERHAGEWHDELRSILAQARISTRVSSAYADNSGS